MAVCKFRNVTDCFSLATDSTAGIICRMVEFHLFNLVLVLLAAYLFGALSNRLGYPSILGEIAAGVLFGPALLGVLRESPDLALLAEVGVFLLLLYIGMEVNYKELMRVTTGGLLSALGGFIIPFVAGAYALIHYGFDLRAGMVLGLALGVTSLTVLSRILVDLKLLGTRMATVTIAGSLIADTLGLLIFGLLLGLLGEETPQMGQFAFMLVKAVVFFGLTFYLGLKVFPVIGRWLKKSGFAERKANFTLVILIGLVFAGLAELAGLHAILGAFLAGLFLRGEVLMRKISHEVTSMVHDLSLGFLAPFFFVSAGFHVDLAALIDNWQLVLAVLALAVVSKTLGSGLLYLFSRNGWKEALMIGVGMNVHGAVEIIIAEIAYELGLIGKDLFSIIVFMAFVTTAAVPVVLKWGVGWLRRSDELARSDVNRRGVLIAGAPPLARLIAKEFSPHEPVWLIDSNVNRCRAAEAEGLSVIRGNALDVDTLDILDAANARMFIAMTPNEQVNEMALIQARQMFGVPQVYAIEQQSEEAKKATEEADKSGERVFKPLWGMEFKLKDWSDWVARKETEPVEWPVEDTLDHKALMLRLSHVGILPLVVRRNAERYIAAGVGKVEKGDIVVGIRLKEGREPLADRFEQMIRNCPVLDLDHPMGGDEFFTRVSEILAERLDMKAKKIYHLLVRREQESSTVIVPGLAIPHIVIEGNKKTDLLLARCRDGVTFFDELSVARIVFVIAGTRDERNLHLRILSAIAQLFQDPTFEDTVLTVEDPEKLRDVILSTERGRF